MAIYQIVTPTVIFGQFEWDKEKVESVGELPQFALLVEESEYE